MEQVARLKRIHTLPEKIPARLPVMRAVALVLGLLSSTALSVSEPPANRNVHSKPVRPMAVETLAPGLVIVRGALSESEQRFVLRTTDELGARESNGFSAAGTPGRARIYERCDELPAELSDFAIRSLRSARSDRPRRVTSRSQRSGSLQPDLPP